MEIDRQDLVNDLLRAISDGKSANTLLELATKAKIGLSETWNEYQLAINVIDLMETIYVKKPDWVMGWWSPEVSKQQAEKTQQVTVTPLVATTQPTPPATMVSKIPTKSERVLAIAEELQTRGMKRINVKTILERLRAQGDQRPNKKASISIGNILSWSGKWKRVAPGEYEPQVVKEK